MAILTITAPQRGDVITDSQGSLINLELRQLLESLVDGTLLRQFLNVEEGADVTDALTIAAAGGVLDIDFPGDGVLVRTALGVYQNRLISGTTNEIDVTNGDGISGNPVLALASAVTTDITNALKKQKQITINSPTTATDQTIFRATSALTINKISAVVRGTTPSVTWTIRHDTDRSASGNEVVTSGTTTTSETTGDTITSFNDATIPIDSYVWLEVSATSGTNDELHVTLDYTLD